MSSRGSVRFGALTRFKNDREKRGVGFHGKARGFEEVSRGLERRMERRKERRLVMHNGRSLRDYD